MLKSVPYAMASNVTKIISFKNLLWYNVSCQESSGGKRARGGGEEGSLDNENMRGPSCRFLQCSLSIDLAETLAYRHGTYQVTNVTRLKLRSMMGNAGIEERSLSRIKCIIHP